MGQCVVLPPVPDAQTRDLLHKGGYQRVTEFDGTNWVSCHLYKHADDDCYHLRFYSSDGTLVRTMSLRTNTIKDRLAMLKFESDDCSD